MDIVRTLLWVSAVSSSLTAIGLAFLSRKVFNMSSPEYQQLKLDLEEAVKELKDKNAAITKLTVDNQALTAQVADLTAQLAAAQAQPVGATPAELTALDNELKPALDPSTPPATPAA